MHPAASIIFFTTASGIGYGMLAVAGMLAAFGLLPENRSLAIAATLIALALAAAGLSASLLHLGRPERAWRALSQWRTSWLSREGVAAVVTFVPALLFGAVWAFADEARILLAFAGLLTLSCSMATVACTAMVYASLKPIHQWHNRWVLPNYLALSLMSGALWLAALARVFGHSITALNALAAALVLGGWLLKESYWRDIAARPPASTIQTATGLGRYGQVRAFEPPHTEENYLLREMGFRIGRKHAARLRLICRASAFLLPFALATLAALSHGVLAASLALHAAVFATLGVLVERWLFFAEAKHTVTLYYGRA